jgi:hypothetical protein
MSDVLTPLLTLLIMLIGLAIIVGFSPGRVLQVIARWGMILVVTVFLIFQTPALLDYLRKNPPRSLEELAVWLGLAFILFLVLLRIMFGPGAVGRFFERIIAAAVYDMLKGLASVFRKLLP